MTDSFYNILGVSEQSDQSDIKKAYRKLSMKWHPDRNSSREAKEQLQKISEAYETLSDTSKRNKYDMMQKNPFMNMAN